MAHKARITEEVVRAEVRKAAVQRRPELTAREMPNFGQLKQAEKGLIWLLVHQPEGALGALETLDGTDLDGLASRTVLDLAHKLNENTEFTPSALLERLSTVDAQLVAAIASETEAHVHDAGGCVRMIKRLRYERERAAIQREIDRLQELGGHEGEELQELLVRKYDLIQRIEGLV